MSPDEAKAEIHEIMYSGTHALHEKFTQSHPDAITRLNELWSQTAVPPPAEPVPPTQPQPGTPPPPQAGGSKGKGPSPGINPGAIVAQKSDADLAAERKISIDHLISVHGPAEAGSITRAAQETVAKLCTTGADQEVYDVLDKLGNDVELIEHAAGLRGKLNNLRTVDTTRMTEQELRSRAVVAVVHLFGGIETPLTRKFEAFFPDQASQERLERWLASKEFGR
jgi:hypothetical protein